MFRTTYVIVPALVIPGHQRVEVVTWDSDLGLEGYIRVWSTPTNLTLLQWLLVNLALVEAIDGPS